MKLRLLTATAALTLVAALAGCGGGGDDAAPVADTATSSAPNSPAEVKTNDLDAEGVIKALAAAGLPAEVSIVFTEDDDPNHLMGRPGQYVSKAAFTDHRVNADRASGDKGDVSYGGGVEVFATEKAASARASYISAFAENMPILNEYTYAVGRYVLRLASSLRPSQAAEYKTAMEKALA